MREESRRLSWDEPAPEDLMDDFLAEWADGPPPELDNPDTGT